MHGSCYGVLGFEKGKRKGERVGEKRVCKIHSELLKFKDTCLLVVRIRIKSCHGISLGISN